MEKKNARRKKRARYNKKHVMIVAGAGLGIVLALVLAVLLIKALVSGGKDRASEASSLQDITSVEVIEEGTKKSSEGEGKADASADASGDTFADASAQEDARKAATGQPQVAAEVAQMDDEEDPQSSESMSEDGAGAQSDISSVIKGADETGDVSFGIDVAKWQGTIDWKQVASAGVEFAIIRAGYRTQKTGIIMEDPLAKYNLQQAKEAGLKLGVYFFSTALTEEEAKEEAAWLTGFIAQYPITYPVVYNCEGFQSSESRQYGMEQSLRSDCAIAFLDYVGGQGYTPMFYAAKNELSGNTLWDTNRLSSRYKIWVSQYPDAPYPQTPSSSYEGTHAMWQYTSQGTVPGVGKGVDMNVAYFSYSKTAEAVDDTPYEVAEADPEALLDMKEVNEQVTAKIETNLRSVPSTASEDTVVGRLKNGETALRTGICASGWSRLEYNGQRVYAVSNYLTTDMEYKAPEAFVEQASIYQPVNETVTAKKVTNLRNVASASGDDTIVATLHNGETATRTGIGNNGWSQVEYNGQTLFAISSYLTTDMGYQQTAPDTSVYTDVNEQVTPKIECNLRTEPTTQSDDTVVATVHNGETLTRTGINSYTGWSRLTYNGQTVYAVSSYLTVVQ